MRGEVSVPETVTQVFKLHGATFNCTIKYRDVKEIALVPASTGAERERVLY